MRRRRAIVAIVTVLASCTAVACGGVHPTGGTPPSVNAASNQTKTDAAGSSTGTATTSSTSSFASTSSATAPANALAQYGTLLQLHMVSATDGWALTSLGVLRTTDGGAHWTVVQDGARYAYAYFLDAEHAWLVDASNVLWTTDGGKTWSKTTLPGATEDTGQQGSGFITFADAQHGWLLRDLGAAMFHEAVDIYATNNGGATWSLVDHTAQTGSSARSLPLGGDKSGIAFSSAATGWAVLQVPASGVIPLYQTTDGGKTWAQASLPMPKGVSLSNTQINAIAPPTFFDPKDGVFSATLVDFSTSAGDKDVTVVWRTQDGGATWMPEMTPATGASLNLSFASPQTWFLLNSKGLRVTTDAGTNWRLVNVSQPPAGGLGKYNIDFLSSSTGFAWTDMSQFWTTKDGGSTWTSVTPTVSSGGSNGGTASTQSGRSASSSQASAAPSPPTPDWIHMITAGVGWGTAPGIVLRTTDGGATWIDVSPPGNLGSLGAIGGYPPGGGAAFLNSTDAWVATISTAVHDGSNAVEVQSTDDGGKTWTGNVLPVGTNTSPPGVLLSFLDQHDGWALVLMGAEGPTQFSELLHTTDGGVKWQVVASGPPARGTNPTGYPNICCFSGLGFANATTGWLSGYAFGMGIPLWRTTDGGSTWTNPPLALAPTLKADDQAGALRISAPVSAGNTEVICAQVTAKPTDLVQFFSSSNAGNSWTGTSALGVSSGCGDWGYSAPDSLWLVNGSTLETSHDLGAEWNTVVPKGLAISPTTTLDFLSPWSGWAANGTSVLRTTDGGQLWTLVTR